MKMLWLPEVDALFYNGIFRKYGIILITILLGAWGNQIQVVEQHSKHSLNSNLL